MSVPIPLPVRVLQRHRLISSSLSIDFFQKVQHLDPLAFLSCRQDLSDSIATCDNTTQLQHSRIHHSGWRQLNMQMFCAARQRHVLLPTRGCVFKSQRHLRVRVCMSCVSRRSGYVGARIQA